MKTMRVGLIALSLAAVSGCEGISDGAATNFAAGLGNLVGSQLNGSWLVTIDCGAAKAPLLYDLTYSNGAVAGAYHILDEGDKTVNVAGTFDATTSRLIIRPAGPTPHAMVTLDGVMSDVTRLTGSAAITNVLPELSCTTFVGEPYKRPAP